MGALKLVDGLLVLWDYKQVIDGVVFSEMNLCCYYVACLFEALIKLLVYGTTRNMLQLLLLLLLVKCLEPLTWAWL